MNSSITITPFSKNFSKLSVRKYTAIELFAGVGGMSLGFRQSGFDLVAAVEKDPIHAATHAKNFPTAATLVSDVAALTGTDIRRAAGLTPSSEIHVLFGGPPCQGFSFGGKKSPTDPRNVGILEFARLVGELKPLYFVMENVDGLFAAIMAPVVSQFLSAIAGYGYNIVAPVRVLDASDFGVPQRRRRIFFLGYRDGLPAPSYPRPRAERVTVSDAIGDLPDLGQFQSLYATDTIRVCMRETSQYALGLRDPEQDVADYALTACHLTAHSEIVRRRFKGTAQGDQEPVSRFFRLDLNRQATTLRAGTDISRGRFTAPRPIHPTEDRCITVREAARLHSFPDSFQFHETIWHGFRQVGNAVPPALAAAVARKIGVALGEREERI